MTKRTLLRFFFAVAAAGTLSHCALSGPGGSGPGNMGGPPIAERNEKISAEQGGDYFIGRRYFVEKTRFWGYLRAPRSSWNNAKLVVFREDRKHSPDRLSENGPSGNRYSFDQNYEYKIRGNYTGRNVYDPNSDKALPEFLLTSYEVINKDPGWLFTPGDRYDKQRLTLGPR